MLVLVRHGETALNAARILQPADTPLSERGLLQAERLATRLADLGVERILASDLTRARMTADAVARATGVPVEHDALLAERSFGDLRGTPYADLTENVFDPAYAPPGGESVDVFERRVARAWQLVSQRLASTRENLVVVTHGLVCRSLVQQFFELPPGRNIPVRFGNTSVTLVAPRAPHTVVVLDSVDHLDEQTADDGRAARA